LGASTAVFGAVGILAAFSMARNRHLPHGRRHHPMAAALALLALLGTEGKETDLGAHLFGFIFGALLGVAAACIVNERGRPKGIANALMALACAAAVVASWWAALAYGC